MNECGRAVHWGLGGGALLLSSIQGNHDRCYCQCKEQSEGL
jgi:hypothetical protein